MTSIMSYFGNKAYVAPIVWQAFGECHYHEPFFGSGAVYFNRPQSHLTGDYYPFEYIGDMNCSIINFMRVIKYKYEELIELWNKFYLNEIELYNMTKQHRQWSVGLDMQRFAMEDTYCDPKQAMYYISMNNCGIGGAVHISNKENQFTPVKMKTCALRSMRMGQSKSTKSETYADILHQMFNRLRHTQVIYGDWRRVISKAIVSRPNNAVFFDPPYKGYETIYAKGCDQPLWEEVGKEAVRLYKEFGNKVIVCEYAGVHEYLVREGFIE